MALELNAQILAGMPAPLDNRNLVSSYEKMVSPSNSTTWNGKALYNGLLVTLPTGKAYILTNRNAPENENSWVDITIGNGSGSGSGGNTPGGLTKEEIEEILGGYYTQDDIDDIINNLTGNLQTQFESLEGRYDGLSGTVKTLRENIDEDIARLRTGITANENEITLAVKNLSGNMISYVDMTAEGLTSTVAALSGFDFSQITQDIDSITATISSLSGLDVTRLEAEIGAIRGTVADFSAGTIAELEITSNAITSRVGDLSSSTISYIEQTAEDITTQVGELSGATTAIEQTANGIKADVYDPEVGLAALRMTAGALRSDIDSLSGGASQILQQAKEITLSVRDSLSGSMISYIDTRVGQVEMGVSSGDVKANVVAWINEETNTSGVKIAADAIQIDGDTGINGRLTAHTLAATAGTIGDIVIKQQSIHSNNFFDGDGERTGRGFSLNSNGTIVATNIALSGNVCANAGSIGGITIAEDEIISNGYNKGSDATGFALTKNGNLYATNASISGTVYSTNAVISGAVYATTLVVGQSEELENYVKDIVDEYSGNNEDDKKIDTSTFDLDGAVIAKNIAAQNQLLVGEGGSMVNIYKGGITANTGQIGNLKLNYVTSEDVETYHIEQDMWSAITSTTEVKTITGTSTQPYQIPYGGYLEISATSNTDFSNLMNVSSPKLIETLWDTFDGTDSGHVAICFCGSIFILSNGNKIPTSYGIGVSITRNKIGVEARGYLAGVGKGEFGQRVYKEQETINPVTILTEMVQKLPAGDYVFRFCAAHDGNCHMPLTDYFGVTFKSTYTTYEEKEVTITGLTSGYTTNYVSDGFVLEEHVYPLYHENFMVDNNGKLTARDAVIENTDGSGYELHVTDTEFLAGKRSDGVLISGITINNTGITTDTGRHAGVQIKGGLDVDLLSINTVEIGGSGSVAKIKIMDDGDYETMASNGELDANTLYITY